MVSTENQEIHNDTENKMKIETEFHADSVSIFFIVIIAILWYKYKSV